MGDETELTNDEIATSWSGVIGSVALALAAACVAGVVVYLGAYVLDTAAWANVTDMGSSAWASIAGVFAFGATFYGVLSGRIRSPR